LRRARLWLLGALAVVVVGLGGGYAYFAWHGHDAPPPPSLARPGDGTITLPAGNYGALRAAGLFAGYRVREHYLGVGTRTAVGRTPAVSGTLMLEGSRVTRARLVADLSQLRSDQEGRDRALATRAIETARFPRATFELSEPFALSRAGARPAGTLELHGQRAPLRVSVRGQHVAGGAIEVVGAAQVQFARFGVDPPSVAGLVTVEDHGVLEFRLRFNPLPR
jgi:polyisoprenoid-binding protein YceI